MIPVGVLGTLEPYLYSSPAGPESRMCWGIRLRVGPKAVRHFNLSRTGRVLSHTTSGLRITPQSDMETALELAPMAELPWTCQRIIDGLVEEHGVAKFLKTIADADKILDGL